MTPMKEDYLKIIFELGGAGAKVSNKQIAISLNIAAGSVTEMVSKMAEEGYVIHEPYAGISLTEEGRRLAVMLVRNHRLWETFLVNRWVTRCQKLMKRQKSLNTSPAPNSPTRWMMRWDGQSAAHMAVSFPTVTGTMMKTVTSF